MRRSQCRLLLELLLRLCPNGENQRAKRPGSVTAQVHHSRGFARVFPVAQLLLASLGHFTTLPMGQVVGGRDGKMYFAHGRRRARQGEEATAKVERMHEATRGAAAAVERF